MFYCRLQGWIPCCIKYRTKSTNKARCFWMHRLNGISRNIVTMKLGPLTDTHCIDVYIWYIYMSTKYQLYPRFLCRWQIILKLKKARNICKFWCTPHTLHTIIMHLHVPTNCAPHRKVYMELLYGKPKSSSINKESGNYWNQPICHSGWKWNKANNTKIFIYIKWINTINIQHI